MKTSLKFAATAAAAALSIGLLTGCGGDQKAASSKEASADGKTSVKLVLSSTERPLSWADENGKLQGYEYDIWQEVNMNLKSYHLDIQVVGLQVHIDFLPDIIFISLQLAIFISPGKRTLRAR